MKRKRFYPYALTALLCASPGISRAIEHGELIVTQLHPGNDTMASASPSISLEIKPGATTNFRFVESANRGDYDVAFSDDRAGDPSRGTLISSVAQHSRNNGPGGGVDGISYATSASEYGGSGFYIPIFATTASAEASGGEFNINVSAAYFPFAEGWLAGHAKNSVNNQVLTQLLSSPGIGLGYELLNPSANGVSTLNLTRLQSHGLPATAANGVLLVVGGKNEDNFALSRTNPDGTFTMTVQDNGPGTPTSYENDPIAFVYIPVAAAGQGQTVAAGRIRSDASAEIGGGDFTVTKQGTGEWLLQIAGQNNDTGTLIISPEGGSPATTDPLPNNTNNIVTFEWSDELNGWLIQSRDVLETSATERSAELEDGATPEEAMFSFAFFTPEAAQPLPSISLTSPATGTTIETGSTLTLAADATAQGDATISKVDFYLQGELIGTASSAPYELPYELHRVGNLVLEAVATDSNGSLGNAQRIAFTALPVTPESTSYAAAIFDGGDGEADISPPADPADWQVRLTTPEPRNFGEPGTVPGAPAILINGQPVAYDSGVLLGTNYAGDNFADTTTRGAIDNTLLPYASGGNYALAVKDNAGPSANPLSTQPESSRFSLAYFPYAEGWIGANVGADLEILGGSANLPEGVTITNPATGVYAIDGLPGNGNLLATGIGAESNNFASIGKSGNTWIVRSYDSSQNLENDGFGFLYVPDSVRQVLSGSIAGNGTLTPLNPELEAVGATVVAGAEGYEITFGDGSQINPSTYALLVSSDFNSGNGGDNIYSYYANGNAFVVFSQDLPGLSGNNQTNSGFRFLATPLASVATTGEEVVIAGVKTLATEGDEDSTLTFRLTRFGDPAEALTVNYELSGTATMGQDYATLSGAVTFEAGSRTTVLTIEVLEDVVFELDESVIVTLAPGSGYSLGSSSTASATIRNIGSLIAPTVVSFQEGVNGYTGQFGKRLGNDGTNQLESAVSAYYLDGYPGHADSPDVNSVIRFDNLFGNGAGQIPEGATVVKAELVLTTANGANSRSNGPFVVDRLIQPVTEETTYDELTAGAGLEGVRGATPDTPVAAFGMLANNQVETADVTTIVRQWGNGEPNYGFALYTGGTADGWEYYTLGNPNPELRPKLVVSYVTRATKEYVYTPDQSARLIAGQQTEDGSTLTLGFLDLISGGTQEALMRFPVEFGELENQIPADEEIVRAELVLLTATPRYDSGSTNAQSPGPIAAHRVLVGWDPTSQFGTAGPVVGQDIDAAVSRVWGMGQNSSTNLDVTQIAQAWRIAPNYGINLKPETEDGWQIYWPGTTYEAGIPTLRIITAQLGSVDPEPTAFDQWAQSKGIPGAGLTSDDDRDGIIALLEYALGLDPLASDQLPQPVIENGNLSLSFAKGAEAAADDKLTYLLESSPDLVDWTATEPSVNNGTEISLTVPLGTDGSARFYRLSVSYAP